MLILKIVIGILSGVLLLSGLWCIIDTILERSVIWKEEDPPRSFVITFGVILVIIAVVGILFICLK